MYSETIKILNPKENKIPKIKKEEIGNTFLEDLEDDILEIDTTEIDDEDFEEGDEPVTIDQPHTDEEDSLEPDDDDH